MNPARSEVGGMHPRAAYLPVKLAQEFRRFDFLSPWEGAIERALPGDEKAKTS